MRGDDRPSYESLDGERDSTIPEIRVRTLRMDHLLAQLAKLGGALDDIEEEIDSEPPPPMPCAGCEHDRGGECGYPGGRKVCPRGGG